MAFEINDPETVKNIILLQEKLDGCFRPIKRVEPENLHLTVRFLGNIDDVMARKIYEFIESEINAVYFKEGPLVFDVVGLGDFNLRTFFVDLRGPIEVIYEINRKVEDMLVNRLGFTRDKKFKTHITIGRLKKPRRSSGYGAPPRRYMNLKKYENLKNEYAEKILGKAEFGRLLLKKSTLTPEGPIYETLEFD